MGKDDTIVARSVADTPPNLGTAGPPLDAGGLPAPPAGVGTYELRCTVTATGSTVFWEAI